MNPPNVPSDFDTFRQLVMEPDRVTEIAAAADVDAEWLESTLIVSLAEAEYTLRWIGSWLRDGQRVLEVGSGLGLTSAFLAMSGVDVCSIEPGGPGFERYERANPILRSSLEITHQHFVMAVEDATSVQPGTFDLIFSNNVLEHVRDVASTLGALNAVLRPGGVMVHNCPNYHVPFEPHFGIPLLPLRPASTARVLPDSITSTGLWQSINFVTASQVRRIAAQYGVEVEFQRGLLGDSIDRFVEPEFAERHPMLARVAVPLRLLTPAFRRLPPAFATPMIVSWRTTALTPTVAG